MAGGSESTDEREQPNDERDQELERLRAFVERSPDALTHIQPDGTMTYVSGTNRILGRSREEFLQEPLDKFIHPDDKEHILTFFENMNPDSDPVPVEGRMSHADGGWVWVEATVISLDGASNIEGFLTVARDISERKKYERRLEDQRDNLEILNEVVRHDIRNDLQLVKLHAELLEDHADEPGEEHLETIRKSTINAVDLTQRARELSEAMLQTEDEIEPVRLRPILATQLEKVRTAYPDAEITTDGQIPGVTVMANGLLNAVFRNLLKNAIQHNDKPTPEISVSIAQTDAGVVVRIADNGPGVPDSMKETVFNKAERGLQSTGSGLGLYLVQSLVGSYDGDVWIEGSTSEGATFVVRLPEAE